MFASLYVKTFFILTLQLFITWLAAVLFLSFVRRQHALGADYIRVKKKEGDTEDLEIAPKVLLPYFYQLLGTFVGVFCLMLLNKSLFGNHAVLGIILFSIWSVLGGTLIACAMISVDENLGGRILSLTVLITGACMLYGLKPGVDLSAWHGILHFALHLLIFFGIIRVVFKIPGVIKKFGSFFGVITFTGYLLFDFNRLQKKAHFLEANTWSQAFDISVSLYLDIINLFLELLDLLGD
jgi:FtsH-binding integral membrane protein